MRGSRAKAIRQKFKRTRGIGIWRNCSYRDMKRMLRDETVLLQNKERKP
jgi:hypothetical protein